MAEAGEERFLAGRPGSGGTDGPPKRDAGCFLPSVTVSLLVLCPGRPTARGAVARRGAPQAVPLLGRLAGLADPEVVVPEPGPGAVLTGQHAHDVDVVGGVADGHPADRLVVLAIGREPGPVHDVARQLAPLVIGKHLVPRCSPDHAMPHRPLESSRPESGVWLGEQPVEPAEVLAAIGAQEWLQFGWVPPSGDHVRVPVFLAPAGPVQVADQSCGLLAAEHLPDHRRRLRTDSAAASSRSALRTLSAAYGSKSPDRCPVAFSFATA